MPMHASRVVSRTFRPGRWALKSSVALLALCSLSGQAQSADYPGDVYLAPGGTLVLATSQAAQGILDLGISVVSNSPIAQPALYTGQPAVIVNALASADLSTMNVNGFFSHGVAGVTGDALGITFAAKAGSSVFTGGSLTLTNLHLDFATGAVSGSVNGSNGVGSHDNVTLWQAGPVSASATATGQWTLDWEAYSLQASTASLRLTQEGQTYFLKALGAGATGRAAFSTLAEDFGTIQVSAQVMTGMGTPIGVVPEPATFATMGLGLVGLAGLMARRRRT